MPFKSWWLDLGGHAPPRLRFSWSVRLLTALAHRNGLTSDLVSTNLGIHRSLRCMIPASQTHARFGTPALYAGERGALELARLLCADADAFLDIGSHLGMFTFYVATQPDVRVPVHYFEPDHHLFEMLAANVQANGIRRVTGHHVAIAAADGQAVFYRNRTDSFSGSLTDSFAGRHDVEPLTVDVRSIATVARELGLTRACVKVDIENAEWQFLDGMGNAFERIGHLIIEILEPAHRTGFVQALMRHTGFRAYYINDRRLEPSSDGSFEYRAPEYNWLFTRDDPRTLARKLRGRLAVRGALGH